ncbi:hypothetical protein DFQ26_008111 [Actinomortierella ambigua]|nr:hypothetical protein DFQ26_008111 [Actinomortierella ambigua]
MATTDSTKVTAVEETTTPGNSALEHSPSTAPETLPALQKFASDNMAANDDLPINEDPPFNDDLPSNDDLPANRDPPVNKDLLASLPTTLSPSQDAPMTPASATVTTKVELETESYLREEEVPTHTQLDLDDQQVISPAGLALSIPPSPLTAEKVAEILVEHPKKDHDDQQGHLYQNDQQETHQHQQHQHQHQSEKQPQQEHSASEPHQQRYPASPSPTPSVSPSVLRKSATSTTAGASLNGPVATSKDVRQLAHHDLVKVLQGCQNTLSSVHSRAIVSLNEVFHTAHDALQVVLDSLVVPLLPHSCSFDSLEQSDQKTLQTEKEEKNEAQSVKTEAFVDEFVAKVQDEIESEDDEVVGTEKSGERRERAQARVSERGTSKHQQDSCSSSATTKSANEDRIRFLPHMREQHLLPSSPLTTKKRDQTTTLCGPGDGDDKLSPGDGEGKRKHSNGDGHEHSDKDQARKRSRPDPTLRSSNTIQTHDQHQNDRGFRSQQDERGGHYRISRNAANNNGRHSLLTSSRPKIDRRSSSSSSASPPSQSRGSSRVIDRYVPRHNRSLRSPSSTADTYRPTHRQGGRQLKKR